MNQRAVLDLELSYIGIVAVRSEPLRDKYLELDEGPGPPAKRDDICQTLVEASNSTSNT